jgi:hypothetical protein
VRASFVRFVAIPLLLVFASAPAFAQATSTSSLSGLVVDADGGVIPGATVVVKNNATNVLQTVVTNSAGKFAIPSLDPGTYTVTVSLQGFKTFVAADVRLLAGRPGDVTARLEIGALTDKVEVKAGTELIQTQSATVTSTLSVEQLKDIPLVSRNALYAVNLLPGVATTGGPRAALINGLPNNTVNITIDGVGTGNMLQSGDGFFTMVTPRMDAIEEITVTGAVPGTGAGAGSVQVQFSTKSGTNQFNNTIYHYARRPGFNSNYFFNKVNNLERNRVIVDQYGGSSGGPIVIPGLVDGRGRAFFFFNFEHLYQPSSATRTRTIIGNDALTGVFAYDATGGVLRTVNLAQLAAANGQTATFDPTIIALMNQIRSAAGTVGTINTTTARNTLQYVYQAEGQGNQWSPTTRVDFNLTPKHRLTGTYYWQRFSSKPDLLNNSEPVFPGFPNQGWQESYRTTGSIALRSTLSTNKVNELRGGWQWSPNDFFANITRDMFANQDFFSIGMPQLNNANYVSGVTATRNAAPRNTTTWSVSDDFTWLRGSHTFTVGGSFSGLVNRGDTFDVVPALGLGFDTNNDPANGMFNTTNFPGASGGNLNEARALYALLTGRVTSINNLARLDAETGKYVYLGELQQRAKQNAVAAYISDSWRWKPTVTVNAGVRWDLPLAFTPITSTYSTIKQEDLCGISGVGDGIGGRFCNLFTRNQTGKVVPEYYPFTPGTRAFNPNYDNFGYNAGVAWRPNVDGGWLRTLLGDPAQATVRAGYSMTYNVERFDRFTANAGSNPGGTTQASRNATTGFCLVCAGESWPVLFRDKNRLGPPAFPEAPVYPIQGSSANSLNMFNPDLRTPRVHSFSVGFQRSIGDDMAAEVRYVGNRNKFAWAEENWNERVVFENGFFDEWRLAAANLKANLAANRGATFAYTGAPGTAPLPIHQAYLSGRVGGDITDPARYTATQYTNSAFLARLSELEPDVLGAAQALDTAAFRTLAQAAGYPINFWVMNPNSSGTFVVQDREGNKFDSLQVELRRRLAQGLLISGNYTYGISYATNNRSLRFDRLYVENTGVPHAWKMNWVFELPVGRGKRFGTDFNPIVNGVIGNWEFSGNARWQKQAFRIANAELVGMSESEFSKAFKIRITTNATTGATEVFSMPQDIIDNTRAAYSTDPTTSTGYSAALGVPTGRYVRPVGVKGNCVLIYRQDCNTPDIQINGPLFTRIDLRLKKLFPFGRRANVEINVEMLNALNNINFNHQLTPGESANAFRVTTAFTDINTTFDPGGRIGQIVWRVNW